MAEDDLLLHALARLPGMQPDPEWEHRVRTRCHSAIVARNTRRALLFDFAAAIALCAWLAAVLVESARLAGLPI